MSSFSLDFGSCSARTDKTKGCVSNRAHSFDGKGREVTSELHLHNMTYEDAGKYQCVVKNKFGTTYSERANITVYVYPTFVVTPEDVIVKGMCVMVLEQLIHPPPRFDYNFVIT